MTAERYERWTAPFRGRRASVIPTLDRVLTAAVYIAYPALIAWLWYSRKEIPWRELWVPASSLVIVSLLRQLIDRRRPYERLPITPLIHREGGGKAFPSRHVFSVFIIAVTAFTVWVPLGVLLGGIGVLIAATRVLGGIHDEWDVAAGAAVGILSGVLGYLLFPF